MNEIQGYHWTPGGMEAECSPSYSETWITGSSYIAAITARDADKTAALEAQADTFAGDIAVQATKHAAELAEKDEEHRIKVAALCAVATEHRVALAEIDSLKAELAALRGEGEAVLIHFENARLIGNPCMIHRDYQPAMVDLCKIAYACDVQLWVAHSVRYLDQEMLDLVVKKAKRSNHLAGSGVDLNPVYEGVWYTNEMMEDFGNLPAPVRHFLGDVANDPSLRWGGDFNVNKDRVHFDDNLVLRDPALWAKRVADLQGATND